MDTDTGSGSEDGPAAELPPKASGACMGNGDEDAAEAEEGRIGKRCAGVEGLNGEDPPPPAGDSGKRGMGESVAWLSL